MNANEAFKVLELKKKFPISEDQVSEAYRAMAKKVHPDITGNDEQMKKVNEAHEWLKNNLGKVNETNIKHEDKDTDDINILDMAADDFVKQYQRAYTRGMKRMAINEFLGTADKIRIFRGAK